MAATTFPRWPGDGQGAFVWGLASALQRQGAEVTVVALHTPGAATHERMDGVTVIRPRYWWPVRAESLRKDGGGLPITLRKYPLARVQLPVFASVLTATLARVGRGCDVVHAHWTVAGAAAVVARPIHRKPVLVTVQGSDIFGVTQHRPAARLTAATLNRAESVDRADRCAAGCGGRYRRGRRPGDDYPQRREYRRVCAGVGSGDGT